MGSNPTATAIYQAKRRLAHMHQPAFGRHGLICGLIRPSDGHQGIPFRAVLVVIRTGLVDLLRVPEQVTDAGWRWSSGTGPPWFEPLVDQFHDLLTGRGALVAVVTLTSDNRI